MSTAVSPLEASMLDSVVADLDRQGFALVPGFLSPEEVEAGRENLRRYYPTAEEFFAAAPERYGWLRGGQFSGLIDFPWVDDALNDHATSPKLVALARRVIGVEDVRLIEGRAWAKYGGTVDYDQQLHADYPNHSLVFPRERDRFRELIAFLYYSDVDLACGPTHVVSWEHTSDLLTGGATALPRASFPSVYEHEVAAAGPAGTLVLYTPATFHRGAALGAPPAYRWITGVAFRAGGVEWVGHQSWPYAGPKQEMRRFIERATVEQRNVLGFPPPGSEYWDAQTLAGVASRYPGMDMTPYGGSS